MIIGSYKKGPIGVGATNCPGRQYPIQNKWHIPLSAGFGTTQSLRAESVQRELSWNARDGFEDKMAPLIEDRPDDKNATSPKKPPKATKQSFDYLWRSGLAGGLAGCAVSSMNLSCGILVILIDIRPKLWWHQ